MEDKFALFQKFLITENAQIDIVDFLINSGVIIILSIILQLTYQKCAKSLSNRKLFAANFLLIAFTTMLIISIVKSSLALSLGLVGALSIVRFRSAIKEPEELAYLFLTISIGLGLGASQRLVVLLAFFIIIAVLWIRYFLTKKGDNQNLFFTITSSNPAKLTLNNIIEIVSKWFGKVELKRFDEAENIIEVSFLIEVDKANKLESCKNDLKEKTEDVKITFIDHKSY